MSRLPVVNKDLCILRLVADLFRESAMVFVCVCEDDAADVRDAHAMLSQAPPESVGGLARFRPDVDERHRILADKIDVHIADVKWRRNPKRNDLHRNLRFAIFDLRSSIWLSALGWIIDYNSIQGDRKSQIANRK